LARNPPTRTGCTQVYWAYFCEDSARNDADGPGAEISPEG